MRRMTGEVKRSHLFERSCEGRRDAERQHDPGEEEKRPIAADPVEQEARDQRAERRASERDERVNALDTAEKRVRNDRDPVAIDDRVPCRAKERERTEQTADDERMRRRDKPVIGTMLGLIGVGGVLGALVAPWLRRRISARRIVVGFNWIDFAVVLRRLPRG